MLSLPQPGTPDGVDAARVALSYLHCDDFRRVVGLDYIRDIQVLCPMNRGGVGARSLNIELQAALNPAGDRKIERFGWTFAPGDKVIRSRTTTTRRSITAIRVRRRRQSRRWRAHYQFRWALNHLRLRRARYAGAGLRRDHPQEPGLGIPRRGHPDDDPALCHAAAECTGVTRGKKLVVLVGQKKAVAIAVRNVSGRRRWSKLGEWLASKR